MGRPTGKDRLAIMSALAGGEATSRELSDRTGIDFERVSEIMRNMARRGRGQQAHVVRHERVRGCKRPVPVYALVLPDARPVEVESSVLLTVRQLGLALFGGRIA